MGRTTLLGILAVTVAAGCGEEGPCSGIDCTNHGICVVEYGSPYCLCRFGYHPSFLACEPDSATQPCEGIVCNEHGDCIEDAEGGRSCACDSGYVRLTGASCTDPSFECDVVCVPVPSDGPPEGADDADVPREADEGSEQGGCDITCPIGQQCCDSACVDLMTEEDHCGSCGQACGQRMDCVTGFCRCWADTGDCDDDVSTGCETDLREDREHCGRCNVPCGAQADCNVGECVCWGGYDDCDLVAGCETNLGASTEHCLACGNSCGVNTRCGETGCACVSDYENCDGTWATGCEADLAIDSVNCGACDFACGPQAHCDARSCVCEVPYRDCNGTWDDGCESDSTVDPLNCGGDNCGNVCGVFSSCVSGVCACFAGRGNCDGDDANGCEVNTDGDDYNCGSCGHVCGGGYYCSSGRCRPEPE